MGKNKVLVNYLRLFPLIPPYISNFVFLIFSKEFPNILTSLSIGCCVRPVPVIADEMSDLSQVAKFKTLDLSNSQIKVLVRT